MGDLGFSDALNLLKYTEGVKVARRNWNGKDMYVSLSPGFELTADKCFGPAIKEEVGNGVGVFRPYLMMFTVDKQFVPWVASQSDLLSDDWFEV